ncbi:melanoma-associated antigen B16-like [Elephas maximus indicus]|uniref:melanoma-associated antigen B16-like n=1 Tax=Elephas maximus indicus TaxID=99487 RepID=UPI002116F90E|nr:melanoma-associated antigen B16-like [Elephas maximus indicus]
MSQGRECPCCTHAQHLEACSESEGLEAAQILKALKVISPPCSRSLMSGNMEEVPAAETPSTHQDPWSGCSFSTAITTTPSSKSDEGSRSPDKGESPITSHSPQDMEDLPIGPPDEMELDPTSHCYALTNKLGLTFDARMSGDERMPNTSLLMIILGMIFMKGNCATEEEIWEVLNMIALYSGRKHFILGEPRNFITKDLVQENYAQYRQVPNSHPPCYEFLWGPRAHAENQDETPGLFDQDP